MIALVVLPLLPSRDVGPYTGISWAAALSNNTVVKCVLAFTAGGRQFGWRFSAGVVPAFAAFLGVVTHAAAVA